MTVFQVKRLELDMQKSHTKRWEPDIHRSPVSRDYQLYLPF